MLESINRAYVHMRAAIIAKLQDIKGHQTIIGINYAGMWDRPASECPRPLGYVQVFLLICILNLQRCVVLIPIEYAIPEEHATQKVLVQNRAETGLCTK